MLKKSLKVVPPPPTRDEDVTLVHRQSISLTKRLIKELSDEAKQGFLQSDDANVVTLFTKGYIANPALTCKELCQEMNVGYSELYDIQKRLNVNLKQFIKHWPTIGKYYNEQAKQQFIDEYAKKLTPYSQDILHNGIFKNLGASHKYVGQVCNIPEITVTTARCAILRFMGGDKTAEKYIFGTNNPHSKRRTSNSEDIKESFLQLIAGMDYTTDIEPLLSLAKRVVYNEYIMNDNRPSADKFIRRVGDGKTHISNWLGQIRNTIEREKYLISIQDQNVIPLKVTRNPTKQRKFIYEISQAINYRKLRIYAKIGGEENIPTLLASVTPTTQKFWKKYLLAKSYKQRSAFVQKFKLTPNLINKNLQTAKQDLDLFSQKQQYIANIQNLYGSSEQILTKAKPYFDKKCYDILSEYMLDPTCTSVDAARKKLLCFSKTISKIEEKILGWLTMYMDSPAPEILRANYNYVKVDKSKTASKDGSDAAFGLDIVKPRKKYTKKQKSAQEKSAEEAMYQPTKLTLPEAIKLMERVQKNLQKLGLQQTVEYQIQKAGLTPIYQSIMPEALKVALQNITSNRQLVLSGKQQPLVDTLDSFVTTQTNKKQMLQQIEESFSMQDINDTLARTPRLYQYFNDVLLSDDIFARDRYRESLRINTNTLLDIEDQIISLVDNLCDRRLDIVCFIDDWALTNIQGEQFSGTDFLLNIVAPVVLTDAERAFMLKFMLDYHYTPEEKLRADREGKIERSIKEKLYKFKKRKEEVDELVTWAGGYQRIKDELEPRLDERYKDLLWNDVLSYFPPTKAERLKKYGPKAWSTTKAIDYLLNELSVLSISAYNSGRVLKNHDNDRRLIFNDYDDDYIAKKDRRDD